MLEKLEYIVDGRFGSSPLAAIGEEQYHREIMGLPHASSLAAKYGRDSQMPRNLPR